MEQLLKAVELLLGNLRRDEQDGWWVSDDDVHALEQAAQLERVQNARQS